MLNHFITEQDFLTKKVRIFTLVVVYDLTEDGSRLDEKILNTAVYKVSNQQAVTGFLTATPAAISTISAYNTIGVSYTINSGPDDLGLFDWTITKSISGAAPTVVRQGNQASTLLSGTYSATKKGIALILDTL
jgi:hypothetical protein